MKNPNPIQRAWRLERRRKQLGSDRCFYCGESDLSCLEIEHPVTRKLDAKFTRAVCRNCHRKLELKRDLGKLTKNGLHKSDESKRERLRRYLRLIAEDQDSMAELLESPRASLQHISEALQATSASLRRQ